MEDIELWLYEVEGHLASDDYGKDLTSVQNLQKKHALLEADVAAHQVPKTFITEAYMTPMMLFHPLLVHSD